MSLILEGNNKLVPIPPNQYELHQALIFNETLNSTQAYMTFGHYEGNIDVFCLQEHCVFGWMSNEWVGKILVFGLWVGVLHCGF